MPAACTLPTVQRPVRVAEFDQLFAAVRGSRRPSPVRLELVLDPEVEPFARELAAKETSCCSFFTFDFASTADGLLMAVGVPEAQVEVLDAVAARTTIGDHP